LETKRRFYVLAHAQQLLELTKTSEELARGIVDNIEVRIGKGAALQSELLLAQLEVQRSQLMLAEARQEVTAAQVDLAVLWGADQDGITVDVGPEPELADLLRRVSSLKTEIDSTRVLIGLGRQSAVLRAERSLAGAEARPSITLSGGYKRIEANNSNSLIYGVSLPLPFFNRNQGTLESLEAELRSLDYETERARLETASGIRSVTAKLQQLVERHENLDSLLLPTSEEAYSILQSAYGAGRIPYTQLLEAQRSLNELHFEHNDMLLEIQEQVITLEAYTGITLRTDKENSK
jgi:cobalt-zinc-cadmium efflux system outer membrane protein